MRQKRNKAVIENDFLKNKLGISDISRRKFAKEYPLFSEEGIQFVAGYNPDWLLENRDFDFSEWPESKRRTQSSQVKLILDFLLREGRSLEKSVAILAGTRLDDAAKVWAISGLAKDVFAYEHKADRFFLCNDSLSHTDALLKRMSPFKNNFSLSLENKSIFNSTAEKFGILDLDFCNNPLLRDEEKLVSFIGRNKSNLFSVILTVHFGRGKRNKKEVLPLQLRDFEHKLWDRYRLETLLKNRIEYRKPGKGVGMVSILYVLEKQAV